MQTTSSRAGGNEYHTFDSDDNTSWLPLDDSFFLFKLCFEMSYSPYDSVRS